MTLSVTEAVRSRRSVRAFEDRPVALNMLRQIMDIARISPSGCNFQPWEATVLTGAPLRALHDKMTASAWQAPLEYDVQPRAIGAEYLDRLAETGNRQYAAEGIDRNDTAAREHFISRNITGFGAPVLLLCYFPRLMGPPQWSDIGMWLQTIMLLLREQGLDSCAQEFLSFYGRLIKEHIGVSDETHIFFCGLAIGYRDAAAPVNNFERPRVALDAQVKFNGFADEAELSAG